MNRTTVGPSITVAHMSVKSDTGLVSITPDSIFVANRRTEHHLRGSYRCTFGSCERVFKFSKDLRRHIDSAHNAVPYYCPVHGCSYHQAGLGLFFKRMDHRIRHIRNQHAGK
ncbi:hypothetical protein BJ878DRAFT_517404 [Calycina marina]|uniref:C2H2-type domain-containing protein n=1 Tax=Calycina marina TaxID=1763456 RepID=A0A9P7YZF3_9HELO|nr:hypothetical protein BJ878DRAFT_517404 [Calycina marina]